MTSDNVNPLPTQDTKQNRRGGKLKIFLNLGFKLFIDVGLPFALYYILKNYVEVVWALVLSSIPPLLAVIFTLVRKRRLNVAGVIIILSYGVSAIMATLRKDARLQLLRESIVTGSIGLAFVVTLIPIKIGSFRMRPLMFYFIKDVATSGSSSKGNLPGLTEDEPIAERWDRYWDSYSVFRRAFIVTTVVWGFGMVSEVPVRTFIVFESKTIDQAYLFSNVVSYTWLGLLILFSFIYGNVMWKKIQKAISADTSNTSNTSNISNISNTSNDSDNDATVIPDVQSLRKSVV